MKRILKATIYGINIVAAMIVFISAAIGVVCEIIGVGEFNSLLETLNMPFGFTGYQNFCMAGLAVMILSFVVKSNCFKE